MSHDPYTPPGAPVSDGEPVRPGFWKRAVFAHAFMLVCVSGVFSVVASHLLPAVSLPALAAGVVLSCLFLYHPVRGIPVYQDAAPWWWEGAYAVIFVGFIAGFLFGLPVPLVAFGLPLLVLHGVLPLVILRLEHRDGMKVFVDGRRYVYVRTAEKG